MNKVFKFFNNRRLNLIFPMADFLHIFQLEEYDLRSFLKWSFPRLHKRNLQKIGELKWTAKAKAIYLLSLLLIFIFAAFFAFSNKPFVSFVFIVVSSFLTPLWLVISGLILSPLESYLKGRQIVKAQNKLRSIEGLTIIAVAGSVGKSTTRHFLTSLLKGKYKTFTTIGNFNTLLGIAEEVVYKMPGDTEVFVVELGEYRSGELVAMARLINPNILVMTRVGSQHLEKFGSQEAINKEFLTLLDYPSVKKIFIGKENSVVSSLTKSGKVSIVGLETSKLKNLSLPKAASFYQNMSLAISVVEYMGVDNQAIKRAISNLSALDRRLNTIERNGITIIDDSYNISLESAENALIFLKSFKGRKILVSGGIVEQGENSASANEAFGQMLGKTVDIVILAKNKFFIDVLRGVEKAGRGVQIVVSNHPSQTPLILAELLKRDDTLLVQNELPEIYWH